MAAMHQAVPKKLVCISLETISRLQCLQVSQARKAAEIGKEDWGAVAQAPPWAVDAWGLGCLMQEAYSGQPLQRTEGLRNLDNIPKPVAQVVCLKGKTCGERERKISLGTNPGFGLAKPLGINVSDSVARAWWW
jgi:hypothetical protein